MKKVLLALSLVSGFGSEAFAASKAVQLDKVLVKNLTVSIIDSGRGPSQEVTVEVEYGNSCLAEFSDEKFIVQASNINSRTLQILLGSEMKQDVRCPAVYQPVSKTILIGQFSHPADGLFDSVIVNNMKTAE
jgi:hypothetical protein